MSRVRVITVVLTLLAGVSLVRAADKAAAPRDSANWVFELLPKAFQRNPRLNLTVITELTAEGKKLPDVSAQHPAYFLAQSAGYRRTIGSPAGRLRVEDTKRPVRFVKLNAGVEPLAEIAGADQDALLSGDLQRPNG